MSISLTAWQYGIIGGLAVSGFATLVTTYDAIANTEGWTECQPAPGVDVEHKSQTRFLVILIFSILAVIAGIILKLLLDYQLYGYGLITAGVVGILYSMFIKIANVNIAIKTSVSWVTFLAFLGLGFFSESAKGGAYVL